MEGAESVESGRLKAPKLSEQPGLLRVGVVLVLGQTAEYAMKLDQVTRQSYRSKSEDSDQEHGGVSFHRAVRSTGITAGHLSRCTW